MAPLLYRPAPLDMVRRCRNDCCGRKYFTAQDGHFPGLLDHPLLILIPTVTRSRSPSSS